MSGQRFEDLPIKRKMIVSSMIPIGLLCLVGFVGLASLFLISRSVFWVNHTHEVLDEDAAILEDAINMQTGMRGYLLAGQEKFLEPYRAGAKEVYSRIRDLKQTVSDNPVQVERLGRIESLLQTWQQDVAEPQIALRREIGDAETMNDMAKLVGEARGKTYFDRFRGQIATFIGREEELLTQRVEAFETALGDGSASAAETQEALDWVMHTYRVIGEANALLMSAIDMETGMRGYLLAGQRAFLEPFDGGSARFGEILGALKTTVSDNPPQVELLAEIEETIENWVANVVMPMIDLRTRIGDAATMDDMADLIGEARGKQYFDAFRKEVSDFGAVERSLLDERQTAMNVTNAAAVTSILVFTAMAIVLGFLVANRIGGGIAASIERIIAAMKKVIDGDEAVKIEGQNRKDEIGEIARATQVFKDNAQKVRELAEADAENAKQIAENSRKLQESAQQMKEEADRNAEKERQDREKTLAQQQMMSRLQAGISRVAQGAVQGDFSNRVESDFDADDLRTLATRINELMEVVQSGLARTNDVLTKFSNGDLSARMNGDFKGAFAELRDKLNTTVQRFSELVGQMSLTGELVTENAHAISGDAESLSSKASHQAASLEETAAAIEELTSTIRANAKNTEEAQKLSSQSSKLAADGVVMVKEAVEAMDRIQEGSKKVGEIIDLIDNISFQTNLLALNASVEAARAGPAGAGFSVVATEVRALAHRASDASTSIRELIGTNGDTITEGVELINRVGTSFETIDGSVKEVADVVAEISSATSEQSVGATEISVAVSSIDKVTQENASVAEKSADGARTMLQAAEDLSRQLSFFSGGAKQGSRSAA
ncbi:MAG: CHASE3 domain-containing protein [Pseudomonadota bacterium]